MFQPQMHSHLIWLQSVYDIYIDISVMPDFVNTHARRAPAGDATVQRISLSGPVKGDRGGCINNDFCSCRRNIIIRVQIKRYDDESSMAL